MGNYVYVQTEPELWTVGFYKPGGEFEPESDHTRQEDAAERVHFLNGGTPYWERQQKLKQQQQ